MESPIHSMRRVGRGGSGSAVVPAETKKPTKTVTPIEGIGGALGLGHVLRELHRALAGAELPTRLLAAGGLGAFAVFAAALASRVWSGLLPVLLGGAS